MDPNHFDLGLKDMDEILRYMLLILIIPVGNLYDLFQSYHGLRTEVNSDYQYINHLQYNLIFIMSKDFVFMNIENIVKQTKGF